METQLGKKHPLPLEKVSYPQYFKELRLQIDDPSSTISSSGLLDIAEACPMLEPLQSSPSVALVGSHWSLNTPFK